MLGLWNRQITSHVKCSVKCTTDFPKVTQVRHLAKDEWETIDSIRLFIEMQNETEKYYGMNIRITHID